MGRPGGEGLTLQNLLHDHTDAALQRGRSSLPSQQESLLRPVDLSGSHHVEQPEARIPPSEQPSSSWTHPAAGPSGAGADQRPRGRFCAVRRLPGCGVPGEALRAQEWLCGFQRLLHLLAGMSAVPPHLRPCGLDSHRSGSTSLLPRDHCM